MPKPLPTPSQRIQSILNHLEIFRSLGVPFTRVPQGPGRQMALPLESKEMEQWLLVTAQEKLGLLPTTAQIRQALRPAIASATFCQHPSRPTPLRFHHSQNTLFVDLGDHANVVAINAEGWSIVEDYQTAWLSPRLQRPLPVPESIQTSFTDLLANALALPLAAAAQIADWIAEACQPSPYPCTPLILTGAARHQTAHLLRDLIDPALTPFQNPSRAHLQPETSGFHLLIFPEVSRLNDGLRRLTQPVIYTNESAIKRSGQSLTLEITQCQRPPMPGLFAALCTHISQQFANRLPQPIKEAAAHAGQGPTMPETSHNKNSIPNGTCPPEPRSAPASSQKRRTLVRRSRTLEDLLRLFSRRWQNVFHAPGWSCATG